MSIKAELPYPGTISLVHASGQFPGCAAKWFWTISGFRRFFTEDPGSEPHGYLVVDTKYVSYFFGLLVGVSVLYTKQLTPEDDAEMREVTRRIQHEVAEIRQKQAEEAFEAQKVKEAADAEVQRLAQVGTKYEARVKHMKAMAPSDQDRKDLEARLNAGDPEVLYKDKAHAYEVGYLHGVNKKGASND